MKKLLGVVLLLVVCNSYLFAQGDLDLTKFGSIKAIEKDIEPLTDGLLAGMGVLTYTDAGAPDVFGISVMGYVGFFGIDANEEIGITEDVYFPGALGLQVGLGTAGYEGFVRWFPELEQSGFKLSALGFGLKYDISDLIPVPSMPTTSVYADYNSQTFSVSDDRQVDPDGTGPIPAGNINSGIKLGSSSFNVGAVVGYDLIIVGIYGKLGLEFGSTNLEWNTGVAEAGQLVEQGNKGDISSTGLRYAVGLTLLGFRVEAGGRGGTIALGAGYGLSF